MWFSHEGKRKKKKRKKEKTIKNEKGEKKRWREFFILFHVEGNKVLSSTRKRFSSVIDGRREITFCKFCLNVLISFPDSGSKIQCIYSKIDRREGTQEKNGARATADISLKYHFSRKNLSSQTPLLFKILVLSIFDSNLSISVYPVKRMEIRIISREYKKEMQKEIEGIFA